MSLEMNTIANRFDTEFGMTARCFVTHTAVPHLSVR